MGRNGMGQEGIQIRDFGKKMLVPPTTLLPGRIVLQHRGSVHLRPRCRQRQYNEQRQGLGGFGRSPRIKIPNGMLDISPSGHGLGRVNDRTTSNGQESIRLHGLGPLNCAVCIFVNRVGPNPLENFPRQAGLEQLSLDTVQQTASTSRSLPQQDQNRLMAFFGQILTDGIHRSWAKLEPYGIVNSKVFHSQSFGKNLV